MTGRDGTGRDGTGRDGTGRDGTGRDGTGRDGTGRDGTGRDGTGRDGTDGETGSEREELNITLGGWMCVGLPWIRRIDNHMCRCDFVYTQERMLRKRLRN